MFASVASMLILAFAVSLDGFGVGVTYGLRKIRIPLLSICIIACCSGLIIWLSMQAGNWLTGYLTELAAKIIGAGILILIGSWALYQLKLGRQGDSSSSEEDRRSVDLVRGGSNDSSLYGASGGSMAEIEQARQAGAVISVTVELKRLGLVIQILRTPQAADVDKSGTISASEAVMLGVALSLDAFGAGIGAAMLGLPALLTAILIAASSALFLVGGTQLGLKLSSWRGMHVLSVLPGILLIVMGIMRLL